jgi:hypothetical protein
MEQSTTILNEELLNQNLNQNLNKEKLHPCEVFALNFQCENGTKPEIGNNQMKLWKI